MKSDSIIDTTIDLVTRDTDGRIIEHIRIQNGTEERIE